MKVVAKRMTDYNPRECVYWQESIPYGVYCTYYSTFFMLDKQDRVHPDCLTCKHVKRTKDATLQD